MKPVINLNELDDFEGSEKGDFAEQYSGVSEKVGAQKLGYSVAIIQPGKKVCPFHNHRVNEEMFLVLEGTGTLRFGDKEYAIKKDDVIACPPGGREVAHQIINTSDKPLKYFCLSTNEPVDVCEYPDSNKIMSFVVTPGEERFKHISSMDKSVDYYEGES